jgi:sugar O-acyltransferase (sialic acid O-acetyltransferase NeuD family)
MHAINMLKMKNKKLVLFGTGAFAEVAYWYFTEDSEYEVVAFTADAQYITQPEVLGLPLIPFEEITAHFPPGTAEMHVAVGYNKLNAARASAYTRAREKGYTLANYICSRIRIWPNNVFGDNIFIFEDNTIQPYVRFGSNIILWSGNHIGHHSVIGSHTFITSHVVISGFVEVGEYCFFGVNATIRDSIKIAPRNIIGAGSLILKETQPDEVYIGPRTEPIPKASFEIKKI